MLAGDPVNARNVSLIECSLAFFRNLFQDIEQHLVGLDALRLCFEIEEHAMTHGRQKHSPHIFEADVVATFQKGAYF